MFCGGHRWPVIQTPGSELLVCVKKDDRQRRKSQWSGRAAWTSHAPSTRGSSRWTSQTGHSRFREVRAPAQAHLAAAGGPPPAHSRHPTLGSGVCPPFPRGQALPLSLSVAPTGRRHGNQPLRAQKCKVNGPVFVPRWFGGCGVQNGLEERQAVCVRGHRGGRARWVLSCSCLDQVPTPPVRSVSPPLG